MVTVVAQEKAKANNMKGTTMNFCSIDPGSPTGLVIFSANCDLIAVYSRKYIDAVQYTEALNQIKNQHTIHFAIIEAFVPFQGSRRQLAYKANTQVQIATEVFNDHILILNAQWNRKKLNDKEKRKIMTEHFGGHFKNSHETDAAMMGHYVFNELKNIIRDQVFSALLYFSKVVRKYPTMKQKNIATVWSERTFEWKK